MYSLAQKYQTITINRMSCFNVQTLNLKIGKNGTSAVTSNSKFQTSTIDSSIFLVPARVILTNLQTIK